MEEKSSTHLQNEPIMVIAEERNMLRTLFDNEDSITKHKLMCLNFRGRLNPSLNYYVVHCEAYIRYGFTADELFEMIYERYIESGYKPLHELYSFIERI